MVCGLTLAAMTPVSMAYSLKVKVTDAAGKAVPDAVVYAEAAAGQTLPKILKSAEIAQQGQQFQPLVTVVQTGSQITFPNHDKVRHQVYSFSPPKIFELKLYAKGDAPPVLFDKSGTVVLGCNIHDQMIAYVQVVNTPYFAKTDAAGVARLDDLPVGKYTLKTWYYTMPPNAAALEQPLNQQAADADIAVKLNTKVAAE
ncbi:methylamine utilization protein [Oxalobacteraceae bacterium CAVE-383]|nr:methylamine utilization protein [Oxalobacteraceae bacterium CAVE-383]